jgi:hypothetical protein
VIDVGGGRSCASGWPDATCTGARTPIDQLAPIGNLRVVDNASFRALGFADDFDLGDFGGQLSYVTERDGQVIEDVRIDANFVIAHRDVTVRNAAIVGRTLNAYGTEANALFEDVTFTRDEARDPAQVTNGIAGCVHSSSAAKRDAISGAMGMTIRRADISGWGTGVKAFGSATTQTNLVVEYSWIHGLIGFGDLGDSSACGQSKGNPVDIRDAAGSVVQYNNIEIAPEFQDYMTAAVVLYNWNSWRPEEERGSTGNTTVTGNRMVGARYYSIYCAHLAGVGPTGQPNTPDPGTVVTDNWMSSTSYNCDHPNVTWARNVDAASAAPISP